MGCSATLVCWGSNGSQISVEVVYIIWSVCIRQIVHLKLKASNDCQKQVACIYYVYRYGICIGIHYMCVYVYIYSLYMYKFVSAYIQI